jgi:hypothetical protein
MTTCLWKISRSLAPSIRIVAALLVCTALTFACSVPVYRYALEKWLPDPYLVTVFHRGPINAEHQKFVDLLSVNSVGGTPLANIRLKPVDLNQKLLPEHEQLWQEQRTTVLPWIVLQTPARSGPVSTVWAGELTAAAAESVMSSPARKELAERLLRGDSIVWLLLESGDVQADDKAFETISAEVLRLQGTLKLPELDAADAEALKIEADSLKLAFSAMRVSRTNPAEQLMVEMLLRVEPDLRDPDYAGQPMAFPVFGRGRALHALVGAGISGELIEDASRFLTGACQCTVKAENPGVDLLFSVDWDHLVTPAGTKEVTLPPLAGFTGFLGEESDAGIQKDSDVSVADESVMKPSENSADANATPEADAAEPGSLASQAVTVGANSGSARESAPAEKRTDDLSTLPKRESWSVAGIAVAVVAGLGVVIVLASVFAGRQPN